MQQQMLTLMQQLKSPGARSRPVHGEPVPPPSLPATHPARPPLQLRDSPWAAPTVPRAPDVCRQCEQQEAHICLQSDSPSDRSSGLIGSRQHSEGPDLTGAAPRLPPAASWQPCHVGRWENESEAGRQEPVSPIAAAEELPLDYAGSVLSSVTSRHGLSVSSLSRKLQKCIKEMRNMVNMGGNKIAYKQKEMCQNTDKICTKLDSAE